MAEDTTTIGAVAKAAGVNTQTLRYYERRGILTAGKRSASGYRLYPIEAIRVVRFIKRAQGLGFTLDEVEALLALRENSSRSCPEVREIAMEKLGDVDEKVRRLRAIRRRLAELVRSCDSRGAAPDCPLLDALED